MNQSNSILAKRIAELERQLSSTKDLLESSMLSEATAKQYAEEVDKHNQELAAQVEALRDAYAAYIESGFDEILEDAFAATPQQHLAERDAQKGRDGFLYASDFNFDRMDDVEIDIAANDYADSIRQEKK